MTHALKVEQDSDAFLGLFAAVRAQGERAGWLELEAPGHGAAAPVRERSAAERTLDAGAWKAVAVERDRSVAVKSRRGPAVLRDLLREHFRGCRVVLVRGEACLPALRARGSDWELVGADGLVRRLTTADLLRALRSPLLEL